MFMKRPRHRIFDYNPRFYNPAEDRKEKKKRRIGFTRQRKFKSRKQSPVILLVLVALIIYIILKLSGNA